MKDTTKQQLTATVMMGLLVAMEIILSRLLAIRTPIVTIGLGFIPVSIAAILFGPLRGGIVGAAGDFIGALLFPIGAYFPGFTVTAFCIGFIFGLFLRERPLRFHRVLIAVLLVNLICSLTIDTYWLYLITGKGVLALLPARLAKCAFMIPVQVLGMGTISRYLGGKVLLRFRLAGASHQ